MVMCERLRTASAGGWLILPRQIFKPETSGTHQCARIGLHRDVRLVMHAKLPSKVGRFHCIRKRNASVHESDDSRPQRPYQWLSAQAECAAGGQYTANTARQPLDTQIPRRFQPQLSP